MSLSPGPLTTGMSTEKLFNGLRRWSSFPIHRNLADLKDLAVRPLRLWIREPAATNETPGFSSAFLLSVIIRLDGHIRRSLTKEYHVGDDPHVLLGAVRSTGNDRRNGLSDPSECLNCPRFIATGGAPEAEDFQDIGRPNQHGVVRERCPWPNTNQPLHECLGSVAESLS